MRLLVAISLFGLAPGAFAAAEEGQLLVATRAVAPAPYEVTLPEKVGLLEAGEHRELAFQVSGRLETLAREGERVAEGEPVATLDSDLEQARLRQAELRLREAHSQLRRVRQLRESDAASERAFESAETAALLRAAELDTAREELARRTLLASFDGVVADTRFDPGEVVSPGAPVSLLMDLEQLRLEVGVPGYQIGEVARGDRVRVTLPWLPGEEFEGEVHSVAPAANERLHLFEVEIRIANVEARLRPGMSARARIVSESLPLAVVVPLDAAVERDGKRVVFFVAEGRAHAVPAADALLQGDHFVLRGAAPKGSLVVRGQRDLHDGMAVRVDNTVLRGEGGDGAALPAIGPLGVVAPAIRSLGAVANP